MRGAARTGMPTCQLQRAAVAHTAVAPGANRCCGRALRLHACQQLVTGRLRSEGKLRQLSIANSAPAHTAASKPPSMITPDSKALLRPVTSQCAQTATSFSTVTQAAQIVSASAPTAQACFLSVHVTNAPVISAAYTTAWQSMLLPEVMAQRLAIRAACNPQGPLKKWEHYPLNSNGSVVRLPMPIKSGDTVQIITGSDKGKVGKVTKVGRCSGQPWFDR